MIFADDKGPWDMPTKEAHHLCHPNDAPRASAHPIALAMEMTLRPGPSMACRRFSRRSRFSVARETLKCSPVFLRKSLGNRTVQRVVWYRGIETQPETLPGNGAECPMPRSRYRWRTIQCGRGFAFFFPRELVVSHFKTQFFHAPLASFCHH